MCIKGWGAGCLPLRGKSARGRAVLAVAEVLRWCGSRRAGGTEGFFHGAAGEVSRLRARPKGAALWNPAAFEKAGETFSYAPHPRFSP